MGLAFFGRKKCVARDGGSGGGGGGDQIADNVGASDERGAQRPLTDLRVRVIFISAEQLLIKI